MFTLTALLIITVMVLFVSLFLISLGGTIFIIFGGDLIIALFIIWFLFLRKKKNRGWLKHESLLFFAKITSRIMKGGLYYVIP